MAQFRPIGSFIRPNLPNERTYVRSSADIEQLKLWAATQGSYLDVQTPSYQRTRLGALTTGPRARGAMSIKGGVL